MTDYPGLPFAHILSAKSAESPCPNCHTVLSGVTGVQFGEFFPPDYDVTGQPTMCASCGALLVFSDRKGRVRAMTEAERNSVEFAPIVQQLLDFFKARSRPAADFTSRRGN
jgi:hypothetical protein